MAQGLLFPLRITLNRKESEMNRSAMKVLCPLQNKEGKTFWMRIGSAFSNRDGSTNVYLNAYPTNGKLQIRDLDERDLRRRERDDERDDDQRAPAAGAETTDDLPF